MRRLSDRVSDDNSKIESKNIGIFNAYITYRKILN